MKFLREGFRAEPGQCSIRVQDKVPVNVLIKIGAEPVQVQQGSGEGSGEGLRGFGAKPSQVQRVAEKVAEEKVLGIFGAGPGQFPTGSAQGFQRLASQHASERFVKNQHRGCWGYCRSLFSELNKV